jgi:hypothetical protein
LFTGKTSNCVYKLQNLLLWDKDQY